MNRGEAAPRTFERIAAQRLRFADAGKWILFDCQFDIELPKPVAADRDLLVRIEATSVNLVDTKVRARICGESQKSLRVLTPFIDPIPKR